MCVCVCVWLGGGGGLYFTDTDRGRISSPWQPRSDFAQMMRLENVKCHTHPFAFHFKRKWCSMWLLDTICFSWHLNPEKTAPAPMIFVIISKRPRISPHGFMTFFFEVSCIMTPIHEHQVFRYKVAWPFLHKVLFLRPWRLVSKDLI